ncbi:MAG: hypothetical protein MUF64_00370 [Polyangiaceae bacterium]|nr:hypothetical protein [Polyangiaceae bacterium]
MRVKFLMILTSSMACSCMLPLDMIAVEEVIIEQSSAELDPLADDRIETKNPQYNATRTITEVFDGCNVTLNKSGSVISLDIPKDQPEIGEKLYPDYRTALREHASQVLPSMELLEMGTKPFNDGLYAAIELGAQRGENASWINKQATLQALLERLVERSAAGAPQEQPLAQGAAARIAAALQLAGASPAAPGTILGRSEQLKAQFKSDFFYSKPLGFYAWTPTLSSIFQQDRFLQQPLPLEEAASMAMLFQDEPTLKDSYQGVLALYAGVTNPSFHRSVTDLLPLVQGVSALSNLDAIKQQLPGVSFAGRGDGCSPFFSFWPPSDSPENRLFRSIYCDDKIPFTGSLIDVLIKKIQDGTLDLTPTESSGFYDRQLHALETLLVTDRAPEREHLLLTRRYKEKLVETFKTLITQRRETHVKQIEALSSGMADRSSSTRPVDIYPLLPVEPFPTFYLRTARAYAFLRGVLEITMGPPFLEQAHRIHEDGTESKQALGEELDALTRRVYGLAIVAARSIGMASPLTSEEVAQYDPARCEEEARAWLSQLDQEADLQRDPRVMTPVTRAVDGRIRAWAVIGVRAIPVEAAFAPSHPPKLISTGSCTIRNIIPSRRVLLIGKQVEVALRPGTAPLDRNELRALCDQHKTQEAIIQALEAR